MAKPKLKPGPTPIDSLAAGGALAAGFTGFMKLAEVTPDAGLAAQIGALLSIPAGALVAAELYLRPFGPLHQAKKQAGGDESVKRARSQGLSRRRTRLIASWIGNSAMTADTFEGAAAAPDSGVKANADALRALVESYRNTLGLGKADVRRLSKAGGKLPPGRELAGLQYALEKQLQRPAGR